MNSEFNNKTSPSCVTSKRGEIIHSINGFVSVDGVASKVFRDWAMEFSVHLRDSAKVIHLFRDSSNHLSSRRSKRSTFPSVVVVAVSLSKTK